MEIIDPRDLLPVMEEILKLIGDNPTHNTIINVAHQLHSPDNQSKFPIPVPKEIFIDDEWNESDTYDSPIDINKLKLVFNDKWDEPVVLWKITCGRPELVHSDILFIENSEMTAPINVNAKKIYFPDIVNIDAFCRCLKSISNSEFYVTFSANDIDYFKNALDVVTPFLGWDSIAKKAAKIERKFGVPIGLPEQIFDAEFWIQHVKSILQDNVKMKIIHYHKVKNFTFRGEEKDRYYNDGLGYQHNVNFSIPGYDWTVNLQSSFDVMGTEISTKIKYNDEEWLDPSPNLEHSLMEHDIVKWTYWNGVPRDMRAFLIMSILKIMSESKNFNYVDGYYFPLLKKFVCK